MLKFASTLTRWVTHIHTSHVLSHSLSLTCTHTHINQHSLPVMRTFIHTLRHCFLMPGEISVKQAWLNALMTDYADLCSLIIDLWLCWPAHLGLCPSVGMERLPVRWAGKYGLLMDSQWTEWSSILSSSSKCPFFIIIVVSLKVGTHY